MRKCTFRVIIIVAFTVKLELSMNERWVIGGQTVVQHYNVKLLKTLRDVTKI